MKLQAFDRRVLLQCLLASSAAWLGVGESRSTESPLGASDGRSHEIRVNNGRIHYREWGSSDAPALVLLHPLPFNSHIWVTLAPVLASRYRVVAWDTRGSGDSEWASEYTSDSYGSDLQGFLSALHIPRATFIGNSMGASLAFMHAGMHPESVERLVLLDTGPGLKPGTAPPPGARPPAPVPMPPGPFDSRSAAAAACAAAVPPFMAKAYAREMSEHNMRQTADGKWDWKFDLKGLLASAPKALADARRWPMWEAVTCPTLVLRGELSPAFPAQAAEEMVAGRKNAELRVIPGAGHFIPLDAPQALAREVTNWLKI